VHDSYNKIQEHMMNLKSGCLYIPATMTHPMAMVGTTITRRLFACFAIYDSGNSTPMANNPVARTTLVTSRVTAFVSDLHDRGLNTSATKGPMTMPKAVPRTTSLM
jgi:hypothetical protein